MVVCLFLCVSLMLWTPPAHQQTGRVIVGHAEWEEPPSTFEEFTDASAAIVHVRIKSRHPWKRKRDERQPPYTQYTAELIETLKIHPELAAGPGADLTFLALGGEVMRGPDVARTTHALSIRPNDEAIVFLRWTPGFAAFQLNAGPHGVYVIAGSNVKGAAKSRLAERAESMPSQALLATLKAAANRKR